MDNDEVQQEHRYRPKPLLRTPGVGLGGQSGGHPGPIPVQHLAGKGAPGPGHPREAGQLPKACPGPGQNSSAEEAPRCGETPLGREAPQPLLHGGGWSRPGLPQGCCGQSMMGGKGELWGLWRLGDPGAMEDIWGGDYLPWRMSSHSGHPSVLPCCWPLISWPLDGGGCTPLPCWTAVSGEMGRWDSESRGGERDCTPLTTCKLSWL